MYSNREQDFFIVAVKAIIQNQFQENQRDKLLKKEVDEHMMQVIEMLNEEREKLRMDSIAQGRMQGIKQGIKEGKEELRIKHIKNMLKEKIPTELISKITGVIQKEINKIKEYVEI